MELNKEVDIPLYEKRNVPRYINIKGFDIYYKEPALKNDIYVYLCRKTSCKYYIKIDRLNLNKIEKKEGNIEFTEVNKHENHSLNKEEILSDKDGTNIRTEKQNEAL